MEYFQARLDSYAGSKVKRTKASSSKQASTSSSKWPHSSSFKATPSSLAEAGFYHNPASDSLDSVTCFMCKKTLGGWEPDDDPFAIHYEKCQDNCSWALVRCQKTIGDESYDFSDPARHPTSRAMEKARLDTFSKLRWPHDAVKGHGANSKALSKAGFVCNSSEPGDDTAVCLYCNLSLSGWDEEDDPYEEHLKRDKKHRTSCAFLKAYAGNTLSKSTTKRPTSKASKSSSRTVSQASRNTAAREAAEPEGDSDDELAAIPSDISLPANTSNGRVSKASSARASSAAAKTPASRRSTRGTSTTGRTPGSKTVSSEVEETDGGSESDAGRRAAKSKKNPRRQTKARVSAIAEEEDEAEAPRSIQNEDVEMQALDPEPEPEPKKKRGRPPKSTVPAKGKGKKAEHKEEEVEDIVEADVGPVPPPPAKKTHGRTRSKANLEPEVEAAAPSSSRATHTRTKSTSKAKVKQTESEDEEPALSSAPARKKGAQAEGEDGTVAAAPSAKGKGKGIARSKVKTEPQDAVAANIEAAQDGEGVLHTRAESGRGAVTRDTKPPSERKSSLSEDAGYATAELPAELDRMEVDEAEPAAPPPSKNGRTPSSTVARPSSRTASRSTATAGDSSKRSSPVINGEQLSSNVPSPRASSRPPIPSNAKAASSDSLKVIEIDSDGEDEPPEPKLKSKPKAKEHLTRVDSTTSINGTKKPAGRAPKKLQAEVIVPPRPTRQGIEMEDVYMQDDPPPSPPRPQPTRAATPSDRVTQIEQPAPGTPISAVRRSTPLSPDLDEDERDVRMSGPEPEATAAASSSPRTYHPYLAQFPVEKLTALTGEETGMTLEQYIRREVEVQCMQLQADAKRRIEEFKRKAAETRKLIETS